MFFEDYGGNTGTIAGVAPIVSKASNVVTSVRTDKLALVSITPTVEL